MKVLKAYYDCQICGKKHFLKAKWKFQCKAKMPDYVSADFEQTVRDTIIQIAKEMLRKLHPCVPFEWDRLHSE